MPTTLREELEHRVREWRRHAIHPAVHDEKPHEAWGDAADEIADLLARYPEVRASRASASPDARPAPSARRAMRDAAEVLEEQARTAEGRLVGAESDPDCDEGTVNVLRREAAKWREPADALRAALDAAPSAREEGLRARVEALVYGPRPTLDEWLDPCGKAGLVRSALASAPASGSDTGAGEGGSDGR